MEREVYLLRWIVVLTIIGASYASQSQSSGNNLRTLTTRTIREALEKAKETNLLRKSVDKRDLESIRSFRCPLSLHHGKRESGDSAVSGHANDALLTLRILMQEYGYRPDELQTEVATRSLREIEEFECELPYFAPCNFSSKYRTIDGSCNNVHNPRLGMAGMIQQRLVGSDYDDDFGSPRSEHLPNPRKVSNIFHAKQNTGDILSKTLTRAAFSFGQFLDHDVVKTPESGKFLDHDVVKIPEAEVGDCCEVGNTNETDKCFNIIIEQEDPFSDLFVEGYCMELKRSDGVFCPDATSGEVYRRQQVNTITSFVDASNVYGSSESRLAELRDEDNPHLLKTLPDDNQLNKKRLPSGPRDSCRVKNDDQNCSIAGDDRVEEIPPLAAMHNLFVTEHNRIAGELIEHYDSEIAFQEARRILIAVMQKIVYDEFLVALFSKKGLNYYNLPSSKKYKYDPKLDPTIINGFAGAVYRFGHTLIPPQMELFSRDLVQRIPPDFSLPTEDTFFDPNMTYTYHGYSRLAYALLGRPAEKRDNIIDNAVRNTLFKVEDDEGNIVEARDLAAVNIQRGRDHGLPSYHEYRKICNLSPVDEHWHYCDDEDSGLTDHTPELRELLKLSGYKSPRHIDLFTGAVSETSVKGGALGPTLECVIGEQFRRLKFADRFWFENDEEGGLEGGFTNGQITAIKKYSFAKVLCNNYDFEKINFPNAFLLKNKRKQCEDIPDLDLSEFVPDAGRSNGACKKAHGQCTELRLDQSLPLENTKCRHYCACLADNDGYYWSRLSCDKGKSFNPSECECVEVPYPTCDF